MTFDEPTDRSAYPTLKLDETMLNDLFGSDDVLPLWVADMDFPAPDAVIEALRRRVDHGIYGYEIRPDGPYEAMADWYGRRYNWTIDRDHIVPGASVLNAISILIEQHSEEGDGVILQPPVFFEFGMAIKANHRRRVKNPLRVVGDRYEMDYEDLEAKAADPGTNILILCNPHNPVGRVWTRDELARAAEICGRHGVLIISDEIHGDIVYPPHRYTPLGSLSAEVAQRSVTCLSPAKTFNVAGAVDAVAVIANSEDRERFDAFVERYQITRPNVFTSAAVEAAYREGEAWLEALLVTLQGNVDFVRTFLAANVPGVKLVEPEGTYLLWLDFRELGLDAKELARFLAGEAKLALNAGYWFGREGAGFARMNIACPRSVLAEAMARLAQAVQQRL